MAIGRINTMERHLMHIITRIIKLLLICCCLFQVLNSKPTLAIEPKLEQKRGEQSAQCRLTYGWDLVKPYQYFDHNNRVIGFQVDLVRAIFKEMGCQLSFQNGDWAQLMEELKQGKVDFMADMTVTSERESFGYFSDTYRKETYALYVRKEDHAKYTGKTITELLKSGFRLGLTKGFLYSEEIEKLRNNSNFNTNFPIEEQNIANYYLLKKGSIDGFLEDSMVAGFTLRDASLTDLIKALPLEYHRGDTSFLFSKMSVSKETVAAFNQALKRVKESEEYKKKWLKDLK